jgi:hypothetical protein
MATPVYFMRCIRKLGMATPVYFLNCILHITNQSVLAHRSVLLMEETGIPVENHRTVASH